MNIAILSDIHANNFALEAVINDVEANQCEQIWVLGDLVGYYYWPKPVIDYFMNNEKCTVIKGNHEKLLERASSDPQFAEVCRKKYGSGINICIDTLSPEQRDWLKNLPESLELTIGDLKVGLYHGSERSVNEYIYPDCNPARLAKIPTSFDYIFFGHTHYPVVFCQNGTLIANPGSVGQPRDVGSLASYIILNTNNKSLSYKRVPFDSSEICQQAENIDSHYPYLYEILKRNNIYA